MGAFALRVLGDERAAEKGLAFTRLLFKYSYVLAPFDRGCVDELSNRRVSRLVPATPVADGWTMNVVLPTGGSLRPTRLPFVYAGNPIDVFTIG
jgi:hypothetical protein